MGGRKEQITSEFQSSKIDFRFGRSEPHTACILVIHGTCVVEKEKAWKMASEVDVIS